MTDPGPDVADRKILTILARTGRGMSSTLIGQTAMENGDPITTRLGLLNRACKDLADRGLVDTRRPRHEQSGRRLARRYTINDAGREHLTSLETR